MDLLVSLGSFMSVLDSGKDFHSNYKVVSLKLLNDVEYEKAKISCNKLYKFFLMTIITVLLHWNNQNPTYGL